eukprot:423371_1
MFTSTETINVNFTIYGVITNNDANLVQNNFNINMDSISIVNSNAVETMTIPGEVPTQQIVQQMSMGFGSIYVDIDNSSNNSSAVNIDITNSNFSNNLASIGTITTFRANNKYQSSIKYTYCIFNNNSADISGGIVAGINVAIAIDNSYFNNSKSLGDSGVLYAIHSTVEIDITVIENTHALTNGAIFIDHSKLIMRNTKCKSNNAQYGCGGCVFATDIARFVMFREPNVIISTQILQMDNCTFVGNYAAKGGASVYIDSSYDENDLEMYHNNAGNRRRMGLINTANISNDSTPCNSNLININYQFEDMIYSFPSKPYILGPQLYKLISKKISVFGSYPFVECISTHETFNDTNISNTISVIITAPKCGNDASIIKALETKGAIGVIIYTANVTQPVSVPREVFPRPILIIKCLIDYQNHELNITKEIANKLPLAVKQLLHANATVNDIKSTGIGLEYELIVDISNAQKNTYTNIVGSSMFYTILAKSIKSFLVKQPVLKKLTNRNLLVSVNSIIETTDFPTYSPTTAPTIEPTTSPIDMTINIPVREISSNIGSSNIFMERIMDTNDILVSFDCNTIAPTKSPTSSEPTESPTFAPSKLPTKTPRIVVNETDDNTVLLYFFDQNQDFKFQFLLDSHKKYKDTYHKMEYIYDLCGWNEHFATDIVSNIIVDTIFEVAQYVCIKFKGQVLKLKQFENTASNSSSFKAVLIASDETDCTIDAYDSFIDLTQIERNTDTIFHSIGTYCTKIVSIGNGKYELKYKNLYKFIDPIE